MKVLVCGEAREVDENSTLQSILGAYSSEANPVLLARVNGSVKELFNMPTEGDDIIPVYAKEKIGMKAYERGLALMFLKALYKVVGSENINRCSLEYGLGRGEYCNLYGLKLSDEQIEMIKAKMNQYIADDLPIVKKSYNTSEVVKLFNKLKMPGKEKLFTYRRASKTNVYSIGSFTDYFFGYMPASTGGLKVFDVKRYEDGLILIYPDKNDPSKLGSIENTKKLFETLRWSDKYAEDMGINNVGELNECISQGNVTDLILLSEALQEKKMAEIAEMVKSSESKKFVMVAGPSSSGKTTFSHRLSIQLRLVGYIPHPIGLDNYYKNRDECPKDEDGNYDFECLEALDIEQFNKDMTALLNGERVEIPTFNFKTGKREYKGDFIKLGKNDILVIEGIHGLNDKLSYTLPKESKFKVYISALNQLNIDEHNRIPTSDGRLLRRMVRDARTRGTSAKDTIAMWNSVRKGEEKYIFPFQEEADVMFNSALLYELAVIKTYAEPLLFGISPDEPEYEEAWKLLKFLSYFLGIDSDTIPHNSIMREFIGGSYFDV